MATAEDICQDFWTRILANDLKVLRQWNGNSLPSYMRTITRNLILDRLRKNGEESGNMFDEEGEQDSSIDPENYSLRSGLTDCIRSALDLLRERDKVLITLKHWKDFSYKQIAETLDITVSNVGVALMRAEQRFARVVEDNCHEWL